MKNVTKILTTVVLCAAVFASTQRTDALGGNAAFWPDDEANISAFPANLEGSSFIQVDGMGSDAGSVGMAFGSGDASWGMGFSNDSGTWFDLGWANNGMGVNIGMTASDDGAGNTNDGFMLSYGNGDVFGGNFGFHYTSGSSDAAAVTEVLSSPDTMACDDATTAAVESDAACDDAVEYVEAVAAGTTDWGTNGISINYAKSGCGFWVFDNMVASINSPDEGDMDLDFDLWGNMGDGAATVMFAMGVEYTGGDSGIRNTANLGVEVDVTSNVTLRGGMEWGYDLSNDGETTGADSYAWSTGAGVNLGALSADFTLSNDFWNNPLGWVSGADDDALWGACTVTYSF